MDAIFKISAVILAACLMHQASAQTSNMAYRNPIIHADYSDPDVIRVGANYYMTASSFNFVPGLPILQSTDLVNWTLMGYALEKNIPDSFFKKVQHGGGVWAPSIRLINKKFVIFYPDPDHGIYKVEAENIHGPWSLPQLVFAGKGLIDPCPIQTNGKHYLVYALAGSRAGLKSVLLLTELNSQMTAVVGQPKLLYDGHKDDPTIEGPKIYARNGWYYIFAPAGGVKTGWQLVLRAKNIEGPYERQQVLQQGNTPINGPHQGAWVTDPNGKDWFFHFQDKNAFGRIVHLQPMQWVNDWPVMGDYANGLPGQPVLTYGKPTVAKPSIWRDDYLNKTSINKVWQWSANPDPYWAFVYQNKLRLFAVPYPAEQKNLWQFPAWLSQKIPADRLEMTTKLHVNGLMQDEAFGVGILGTDYARLFVTKDSAGYAIQYAICVNAEQGKTESIKFQQSFKQDSIQMRIRIQPNEQAYFGFSLDGIHFQEIETAFQMKPGKWVGARIGFFCLRRKRINDAGSGDIDWVTIKQ